MRMEKEGPGSYPPKLVQTFLREVVEKNGEKVVIKYKNELNEIKDITYNVSSKYILRVEIYDQNSSHH